MRGILGLILVLSAGAAAADSWETTAMRTPRGGLVRPGMTSQEVLRELGEPRAKHSGKRGKSARHNEQWTYRGADGTYRLTFSGDRVVRIDVTPDRD